MKNILKWGVGMKCRWGVVAVFAMGLMIGLIGCGREECVDDKSVGINSGNKSFSKIDVYNKVSGNENPVDENMTDDHQDLENVEKDSANSFNPKVMPSKEVDITATFLE